MSAAVDPTTGTLVDALTASGDLGSAWRDAFAAIPRRQFLPRVIYEEQPGKYLPIDSHADPTRWRDLADGFESVVTQVDDGAPTNPDGSGAEPTSSASMPAMVARMLRDLDVSPGDQVLEIGTGSGWNAALLAHRLGAPNVVTIEIDPRIADYARAALTAAGYGDVHVINGDGEHGHPPRAPYDAVISTAACHTVPSAWAAQTRRGGRIVTPWGGAWLNFGLVNLTSHGDGHALGHIVGRAAFMRLRDQRIPWDRLHPTDDDERAATVTKTDLYPTDLLSHDEPNAGALMAFSVHVPGVRTSFTPPSHDPDGMAVVWCIDHETDSWARLEAEPGAPGPYRVLSFGPRDIWHEVESAHQWWRRHGCPPADRYLFHISPAGQQIALTA